MEHSKDLVKPKTVNRGEDSRSDIEKNLRSMYEQDKQIVRGLFKYYEVPSGFVEFMYKKYKWDKLQYFKMYDNQVYSIPLGVAKHLNTNPKYPVHENSMDENGKPTFKVSKKIARMAFQSLEFTDHSDMDHSKEILIAQAL